METTFYKRRGTTNTGADYELLNIANISMQLVMDETIRNFRISSHACDFGYFDDIIVETEMENGTEMIYAMQLKHNRRGILLLTNLTQSNGDYSIEKYFRSVQTLKVPETKFILWTNARFNFVENMKFYLDGENFPITATKINPRFGFKFSQQTNHCYKFSVVKDGNHENNSKILLYDQFFDSFFLYAHQDNIYNLERNVVDNFQTFFCGNHSECDQYIKFLNKWCLQEGINEKLNKKWIKIMIALNIFYSRILPLSFDHNDNIQDPDIIIVKRNILREAIVAFDITIFEKESYYKVKDLWYDAKCELKDLKTVNKIRQMYQLGSTYISDIDQVDSLTLSILLWLMGKCPLILTQDANIYKAVDLCADKKIILIKDDMFPENIAAFKTLSDLEPKTLQYQQIVQNLTCSIQGKEEIRLLDLINGKEEILTAIKTDDLLEMTKGQCTIAEAEETLPVPYIERSLLKDVIDFKIIDSFTKETQIILDCLSQQNYLNNTLKRHNLVDVNDYLNAEIQQKRSVTIDSSLGTTIYLSKKRCEYSEFNAICNKTQNVKHFHQFRLWDCGNLEWIRSNGGVSHLEKYKLSQYYTIDERDLSYSEFDNNNINLLVSDPGMGKSELLKSFKIKCFPDCFTVIIDPKDVYSFLKNTSNADNYMKVFKKFLLDGKSKTLSKRDKDIFRIFLRANKIIYVWDALDELSDKYRQIVADIIVELSQNCVQWVTSRCHLQNMLESKFNVLSLNLTKFNEWEQSDYIEERLGDVDWTRATKTIIIDKIKSSFALVEHKGILGIPLQLFTVTELFRKDQEKYSMLLNNLFPVTDLYNYLIENVINIYFREKLGIVQNTISVELFVQSQKDKLFEKYTNAALALLFPDSTLKEQAVQNELSIRLIDECDRNVGLITDITDQIPRFLHNSFAEYLAARYFARNLEHTQIQAQDFFDPKYNNVRFFFDLLLAKDSQAHAAILYKNFSFIQSCDSQVLESTDLGGRSVLHLACSWGQKYPDLNVEYIGNTCIIDDDEMYSTVSESNEYLATIDYLLKKCNLYKTDKIYKMTPGEYARKSRCLAAEMRTIMKQHARKSLEDIHIINILYYSAYFGYCHEFVFFFGYLKQNFLEKLNIVFKKKLCSNIKNNRGMTLFQIAATMGQIKIVEFLLKMCYYHEFAFFFEHLKQKFLKKLNIIFKKLSSNIKNNRGMTLFQIAATMGHIEIVEFLVEMGSEISLTQNDGVTLLYVASTKGHYPVVEFLVEASTDINIANEDGFTPLHSACSNGHYKIVQFLVKAGAGIDLADKDGFTPLNRASQYGCQQIVEFLVKVGANIDLQNQSGLTPLNTASANGHYKIVEFLVNEGANYNLQNQSGLTPLNTASANGHYNIVEFLLKAGAAINLVDKDGFTPVNAACWHGHDRIVELLIKAAADINLANKDGFTPLIAACEQGHFKIAELLVKGGAEVNLVVHKQGVTALHTAFEKGHNRIVEFLIEKNADMYLSNYNGVTPLIAASSNGHYKTVELFVKEGAGINVANNQGVTPLHMASQNGYKDIVDLLLQSNANINYSSKLGITPLKLAQMKKHEEIVTFLKARGAVES